MAKPLIVANWKMNTNLADASVLATLIRNELHELEGVEVALCPPFIWLQEVASILEIAAPHLAVGAQNVYPAKDGAYTGEISVSMLKDLCQYVIVGHSERRDHFKESSEFVSEKVQAVLAAEMTPIVCVGEQAKSPHSLHEVVDQLHQTLAGVERDEYNQLVVAYEPVWAIGTGDVATSEHAEVVCGEIKKLVGKDTRVLYGGSVTADTISGFTNQPSIDGALVGGASLKAKEFVEICRKARS